MTMVSFLRNGAAVQSRPRLVLIATSLGMLFAQIDTSVVNLALKRADFWRMAGRQHWLAQHLLRDPAGVRGCMAAGALCRAGKRRSERPQARFARPGAGDRWAERLRLRRDRRLA